MAKWAVTTVALSRETRRRMGKAHVQVVDTADLERLLRKAPGALKTALQVERAIEEFTTMDTIQKVVDVRARN